MDRGAASQASVLLTAGPGRGCCQGSLANHPAEETHPGPAPREGRAPRTRACSPSAASSSSNCLRRPKKVQCPFTHPIKISLGPLKAQAIVSGAARKGPPSVVPFTAGTCHKVYLPSLSDHADDGRFVRAEGHRDTHDLPQKAVSGEGSSDDAEGTVRVCKGGNRRGRVGECGRGYQVVPTIRSALRQRSKHILGTVIIV